MICFQVLVNLQVLNIGKPQSRLPMCPPWCRPRRRSPGGWPGRGPWYSPAGHWAGGNTAFHSPGRGSTITPRKEVGAAGQGWPESTSPLLLRCRSLGREQGSPRTCGVHRGLVGEGNGVSVSLAGLRCVTSTWWNLTHSAEETFKLLPSPSEDAGGQGQGRLLRAAFQGPVLPLPLWGGVLLNAWLQECFLGQCMEVSCHHFFPAGWR